MVMFAKAKAAVCGAAVAGLGWVTMSVVHPQPPPRPQGTDFVCPDVAGINYVRDPEDVHGFYLCVDGLMRHQFRCPQVTVLVMGMPPKCVPYPHVRP